MERYYQPEIETASREPVSYTHLVIAAYLKLKGKHVTLFDRFPQVLEPIRARGGIQLEGVAETGFAKLDLICEDVAQAVKGAEVIFVVLPAFAHAYVAQQLAGCLEDGQTVVVCPGRCV